MLKRPKIRMEKLGNHASFQVKTIAYLIPSELNLTCEKRFILQHLYLVGSVSLLYQMKTSIILGHLLAI